MEKSALSFNSAFSAICSAGFFLFACRVAITSFLAIYLTGLHFSMFQAGVGLTLFGLAQMLASLKVPSFRGVVFVMTLMLAGCVSLLALASVHQYSVVLICLIITGWVLGQSLTFCRYLLASYAKEKKYYSLYRLAINVSASLAVFVYGLLIHFSYLYVVSLAVPLLALAYLLLAYLARHADYAVKDEVVKLTLAYKVKRSYLLFLIFDFVVASVMALFFILLPVFVVRGLGASALNYAWLSLMSTVLILLFEYKLTLRLNTVDNRVLLLLGAFLICLGLGLLLFVHHVVYVYCCVFVFVLGEIIYSPVSAYMPKAMCHDECYLHHYTAAYESLSRLPMLLAPLLFGGLYDVLGAHVVWLPVLVFSVMTLCALPWVLLRGSA